MKKEELIVIAVIAIAVIAMIYTQKHSSVSTQAGAAPGAIVGNGGAPIATVDVPSPIAAVV